MFTLGLRDSWGWSKDHQQSLSVPGNLLPGHSGGASSLINVFRLDKSVLIFYVGGVWRDTDTGYHMNSRQRL